MVAWKASPSLKVSVNGSLEEGAGGRLQRGMYRGYVKEQTWQVKEK